MSFSKCGRCGMNGLHDNVNHPESKACLNCGNVEYLGGIAEARLDGNHDFSWGNLQKRARLDMQKLKTAMGYYLAWQGRVWQGAARWGMAWRG